MVDQQRLAAETRINLALANSYTTPFKPVPDVVNTLTIKLAAGYLLISAYGSSSKGDELVKYVEDMLKSLSEGGATIPGEDGQPISTATGVFSWPDGSAPRMFRMDINSDGRRSHDLGVR